jgi:peptidoglycan-N-acetylglucosamine deacetylase
MVKFIPFGILISSIFIDVLTLIIVLPYKGIKSIFIPPKKIDPKLREKYSKVAIIIPAYNEEKNIARTIHTAYSQTIPPKRVIVVDDKSTDNTNKIVKSLQKQYPKLKLIKRKVNSGKASNIRYALIRVKEPITLIQDSDTFLARNYIEEITKPFTNNRVVIATGMSLPVEHKNFFGKIIYHGSSFQYKFFCFRKQAQSYRNAISVVTGDSAAYRTSYLKAKGGLPEGTQTEDMDLTWQALIDGYRIVFQHKAQVRSKDAETFKGHWFQMARWYGGGFQCIAKHNKNLNKAKPLLYTTLAPVYVDSFLYAEAFLLMPLLIFFIPLFVLGFYLADLLFTVLAILIVDAKSIFHLPEVYIIKFVWASVWLFAGIKTIGEVAGGKREWTGRWSRDDFYKKSNENPSLKT